MSELKRIRPGIINSEEELCEVLNNNFEYLDYHILERRKYLFKMFNTMNNQLRDIHTAFEELKKSVDEYFDDK
jgi:hypothetical protein